MTGLYLHVPFCVKKCNYCDFYSISPTNELICSYIGAMSAAAAKYAGERIDTVYFGGGNPLLLGVDNLLRLLDKLGGIFDIISNAEISLEANPENVTPAACAALRQGGFTRMSIGVQSLDDNLLALLGRRRRPA